MDIFNFILPINEKTPMCIVNFISTIFRVSFNEKYKYHSGYLSQYNDEIHRKTFELIKEPEDDEMFAKWKLVLNPFSEETWSQKSVLDGIESVLPYFTTPFIPPTTEIINYSGFGNKTNTNAYRINEIMCFRICLHFTYDYNTETTFEEMIYACKMLLNRSEIPGLRRTLIENIKHIPDELAIKMAFNCSSSTVEEEHDIRDIVTYRRGSFDESSILRTLQLVDSATFLSQRMVPENNSEAIVMAMIRFGICIAESQEPLLQFNHILRKRLTKKTISKFVPQNDVSFMIKYTRNPEWFKIDNNWFDELLHTYTQKQLSDFSYVEGYTEKGDVRVKDKVYISFLRERRKINNFYFGKNPYCDKKVTYYLDGIDEISEDELISYGSIVDNTLEYMSVEELTDYFKETKIFIDPLTRKCFNNNVLIKLKRQVEHIISLKLPNKRKFVELKKQIDLVENAKVLIDTKVRELSNDIKSMPIELRDKIHTFFIRVIHMAFYMRGWKINGMNDYPIRSEQTMYERSVWAGEVFDNVCIACHYLYESFNELPHEIQENIKLLNLITFAESGNKLHIFDMTFKNVSINRESSLMDCINKSIRGEDDLESSCIRSNSNHILFTAAWYSYIFGFTLDFSIEHIEEIK